jgi:hypothetical protein
LGISYAYEFPQPKNYIITISSYMENHRCTDNVWWLESKVGREGDKHGTVIVRGTCSICDKEVYSVGEADNLQKQTELSEKKNMF